MSYTEQKNRGFNRGHYKNNKKNNSYKGRGDRKDSKDSSYKKNRRGEENDTYGFNDGSYRNTRNNRYGSNKGRGGGGWNKRNSNNRGGRRFNKANINPDLYVNENATVEEKTNYHGVDFASFNLDPRLQKNLETKGFVTTTEIQDKAIPHIMDGRNLLGISRTGSGKTGAFLVPMLQKVLANETDKLLVLAPTRELAEQIAKEAITFLQDTSVFVSIVIGGESAGNQVAQLKRGGKVIIGTPGRINDFIKRGIIKIASFNNVVIDEVDRMLDMGFIDDIRKIYSRLSEEKQVLLFSATHNNRIQSIVDSLVKSYEIIKLSNNVASNSVIQSVVDFTHLEEKVDLLQEILKKKEVEKAIIFVETKRFANTIEQTLRSLNYQVGVIHGDKKQNFRKRMIDMFRKSKINYLVATDVAARGIDIEDITHVINLDEPNTYDEYIHRIGRTGRNGAIGTAFTFVKRK